MDFCDNRDVDRDSSYLTSRQVEYLRGIADGEKCEATALRLGVSLATVSNMRKCVLHRLGAKNAPHAVSIGYRDGWLG